jgi:hypothetical protein
VPTEAKDDTNRNKVDLSETLFHGPIFLVLNCCCGSRSYLVPVFGGTINNVFSTIHKFYRIYKATYIEEGDRGIIDGEDLIFSMGDETWFEGLLFESSGIWSPILGS